MPATANGPPVIPAREARLLLMGAQGLLDDPERPASAPLASLQKLIERIGFVQLDTINVIERAQHLTIFSRMHSYGQPMLAKLLEDKRSLFEHWTHDASAIPSKWFPHWRHRFERSRARLAQHRWWRERMGGDPERITRMVLERIRADGPVLSRDFEQEGERGELPEGGAWWGWKPQKAALEHLWRIGALGVQRRMGFQKVYDLMERVLPRHTALPDVDADAHVDWACESALERLVIATPAEIAGFWNAIDLGAARKWCDAAARAGRIVPVMVQDEGGADGRLRRSFALHDWRRRLAKLPEPPAATRLLSPFDPVIRDRKRALRLFNFDYRFEAFVPAPQRRYGYYVMPILEGERIVGRIDPKLHRERGLLELRGPWWEPGVRPTRARRAALDEALARLAMFVNAREVALALT